MKRQEASAPDTPEPLPGTQGSPAQVADDDVTQGHLWHSLDSPEEAWRCAQDLAAQLNPMPMPSEYYLG